MTNSYICPDEKLIYVITSVDKDNRHFFCPESQALIVLNHALQSEETNSIAVASFKNNTLKW